MTNIKPTQNAIDANHQSVYPPTINRNLFSYVTNVIHKTTDIFVSVISFPTRYFGSKSWGIALLKGRLKIYKKEGYHHNLTPISQQEARHYVRYAAATAAIPKNDEAWTIPFGYALLSPKTLPLQQPKLPSGIQTTDEYFFDRSSGLKVSLFRNAKTNETIVCFGAIGSPTHELGPTNENFWLIRWQYIQMFASSLGAKMSIFDEAAQLCSAIKSAIPEGHIKLVGMCMGGALAQYAGLQTATETLCFNSLSIGAGLQQAIGDEKLALADRYITHISCKKDWASGEHTILTLIDRIFCAIGVRTPGNFGRHYSIPSASAYKTAKQIHDYLFGSIVSYLGYHYRTLPCEMSPTDRQP